MIIKRKTYEELVEKLKRLEELETLEKRNSELRKENYCLRRAFLEELAKYSKDGYKPTRFEWVQSEQLLGLPKLKIMYEKK